MNFSPRHTNDTPLTLIHLLSNSITTIRPTLIYKFLGILFDLKLRWNAQTKQATRLAEAWINLVCHLTRTSTGVSAKGMRLLYMAIAVPRMTYAAEVWYTIPRFSNMATRKRAGMVKFTQKLTLAQRRATITMLGAMRTMAGDALNTHAHLPPLHLLFLKTLIRSATHLISLPTSHPLHKPSLNAIKRPPTCHKSPIHTLFLTTCVKHANYETILTTRRRHNYRTLANVHIDNDRTVAVENTTDIPGLVIYTESSGFKHGIGAATIMVKNGTVIRKLKYYLGSDLAHTVYEAEALAIVLALHMACEVKEMRIRLSGNWTCWTCRNYVFL